jgi:hypothetical protein
MYEMRQNIVPILEEYGVDLVLAGHSHNYERSYLLHGHYGVSSTLQPAMILDPGNGREQDTGAYVKSQTGAQARKGAVYLTVGSSGSTEDLYGHHPAMFIARAQLGSLVLDVDGSRLDGAFLRETGAIDDRFTIIKGEPETLRLLPLVLRNGKVTVRWKAIVGRSYGIERHASWGTQSWEAVGGPITATGATCIWTNDQSGAGASFYRVVELPPASPARGGTVDDTHRPATDRVPANRPRLGAGEPPGVTDARPLGVPQAPVDAGTEPGELVAILAETASRLRGPAKDGGSPGATDELALQLRKVKAANRDGAAIQTPWLKQTRLRG